MNTIVVKAIRSDDIYKKIMEAPLEKKDDIYRYELMKRRGNAHSLSKSLNETQGFLGRKIIIKKSSWR